MQEDSKKKYQNFLEISKSIYMYLFSLFLSAFLIKAGHFKVEHNLKKNCNWNTSNLLFSWKKLRLECKSKKEAVGTNWSVIR